MDLPRKLALEAVVKIEQDSYSNIILDSILKENRSKLERRDQAFISELVYGVITWKLTLDTVISMHSKIKLKKMSKWVLGILRLGAYQILFLDKVPKSAAVNESVNLCKKYANRSTSFVNAILRKIEKEDLLKLEQIENEEERISKTTSMPIWLVRALAEQLGIKKTEEICKNSNKRPEICIRVNTLKTTKEKLKKQLEDLGIQVREGFAENFLIINKVGDISKLETYQKGYFTIQDEAAGLTSIVLDPKPGELVLDCCSAPGGKTTHMAERMKNTGKIVAWDLYESRLKKVEENARRLEIDIIECEEKDSSAFDESQVEKYDRVLLDVPCLGLGVLKRKPDIKWQKTKEDVEGIVKVQERILDTCSKYVKKGGYLVYSTCSILKEENHNVIERFLNKNKDFSKKQINNIEINQYLENQEEIGEIQLYQDDTSDGFYICLLHKD